MRAWRDAGLERLLAAAFDGAMQPGDQGQRVVGEDPPAPGYQADSVGFPAQRRSARSGIRAASVRLSEKSYREGNLHGERSSGALRP
jgi:hypothetical protein